MSANWYFEIKLYPDRVDGNIQHNMLVVNPNALLDLFQRTMLDYSRITLPYLLRFRIYTEGWPATCRHLFDPVHSHLFCGTEIGLNFPILRVQELWEGRLPEASYNLPDLHLLHGNYAFFHE